MQMIFGPRRERRNKDFLFLFKDKIGVTRLEMNETDIETLADFMARVLMEKEDPASVEKDVVDFCYPL